MIVISFIVHALAFLLCLRLSEHFLTNARWFHTLGQRLINAKEKQLLKNPILKGFVLAVDKKRLSLAALIIFSLILLKSLVMVLPGFIGLSLVLVSAQGLMMAALQKQLKSKGMAWKEVSTTVWLQLCSMLIPASLGSYMGWLHWQEDIGITEFWEQNQSLCLLCLVASILFALLAARKEVAFFVKNRSLIT